MSYLKNLRKAYAETAAFKITDNAKFNEGLALYIASQMAAVGQMAEDKLSDSAIKVMKDLKDYITKTGVVANKYVKYLKTNEYGAAQPAESAALKLLAESGVNTSSLSGSDNDVSSGDVFVEKLLDQANDELKAIAKTAPFILRTFG